MNSRLGEMLSWLKLFFFSYFLLGVLILFLSVILDLNYPLPNRSYLASVSINMLGSIGVAVVIAAIFSYASGTSEFIDKIKNLLEKIVIERNFLGGMDAASRKKALKALIQPTAAEKNKYPNIGDYYDNFANKTLEIGSRCLRSNYYVNSRAFFDGSVGKLAVEGVYSYRLYPGDKGFNDITLGFEEGSDGISFCHYVAVGSPNGKRQNFSRNDVDFKVFDQCGDVSRRANISMHEIASSSDNHLDIEFKVTEYGGQDRTLITFKALQPTDGFKFYLHCDEGVKIEKHAVFVVGAEYYLEIDKECSRWIMVGCTQWINEGSGLSILVSVYPKENGAGPRQAAQSPAVEPHGAPQESASAAEP